MVALRKEVESFLAKNLLFLRKSKGLTLEDLANMLDLSGKSSYKAYEEGRALPDIHKVMKLASFYDVAVAELLYQDVEHLIKKNKVNREIRLFEIPIVPVSAAAGYARSFGDNEFVSKLKTLHIPYEPYGIARAFKITGDSMEPDIADGSTVVGIKINASDIKDNKSYIVVSNDGLQCKNVRVDTKSDFIYLISKNQKYSPKHIRKDEVLEMWEVWKIV